MAVNRFGTLKRYCIKRGPVFARQLLKERVMSLVTYSRPIIAVRLRDFLVGAGRRLANIFDAIAEARIQRALIEAQLYLDR